MDKIESVLNELDLTWDYFPSKVLKDNTRSENWIRIITPRVDIRYQLLIDKIPEKDLVNIKKVLGKLPKTLNQGTQKFLEKYQWIKLKSADQMDMLIARLALSM